jgi:flagellar hook-associated protein 1 FlgK
MSTQKNSFNAQDLDIILKQGAGIINVTKSISGGELQGTLDFKNQVLEPSRRSLGRIAMALTEEMNAQHRLGMTLQDTGAGFKLGGDFFTDLSDQINALSSTNNTGTGNVIFNITDSKVLTTSDYRLDYVDVATGYVMTKLDDPSITYAGLTLNDLNNDINTKGDVGFNIDIATSSGVPLAGDSFLVRPTFEASVDIDVSVNNVLDIALAAPMVSREGNDTDLSPAGTTGAAINSGNSKISSPTIGNMDTLPASDGSFDVSMTGNVIDPFKVTLTYDGTNFVDAVAGVTLAFDPNSDSGGKNYFLDINITSPVPAPLDLGRLEFAISGTPEIGDILVIENNAKPYDDNRNGLLMAQLQTEKTLENSSTDFQAGYAMIVSDVGTKTKSSEIDLLAQLTLNEQAKADRESYSGVNLDEEAAALLKYQQAYQAAARVISAADEMFQTLIGAV